MPINWVIGSFQIRDLLLSQLAGPTLLPLNVCQGMRWSRFIIAKISTPIQLLVRIIEPFNKPLLPRARHFFKSRHIKIIWQLNFQKKMDVQDDCRLLQ